MYCTSCGRMLHPGARFCDHCGMATSGASYTWAAAPAPTGINTPAGFREFASVGRRAAALIIDGLIQGLAAAVVLIVPLLLVYGLAPKSASTGSVEPAEDVMFAVFLLGLLAAVIMAYGYRWWGNATGRPFGKRLVGIRVVREDTGTPPGAGKGFVRFLIEFVLSWFYLNLLSYLWPLWDAKKQTIHDKAAGTVVVRDAVQPSLVGGTDPLSWPAPPPAPRIDEGRWSWPG